MTELAAPWAVWAAAGLSFLWFAVHTFVGGRQVAGPFRADPRQDHTLMATLWMCWHMVTASLFLMGVFFVMGAVVAPSFAVAGAMLSGAVALAGIAAPLALGTTFRVLPQGWLFVPCLFLGLYGVWGGGG